MSTAASRFVFAGLTAGALFAAALSMTFAWKTRAALQAAELELARLRAQLAAQEQAAADEQEKPAETAAARDGLRPRRPAGSAEAATNVLRRLDDLEALQFQTLALVQTLAEKVEEAGSPEQKLKQRGAALAALEAALIGQQQQAAAAKRAMDDLRVSLQVPDDVVALEPATGLALASLRQYWPYLEAKRNSQAADQAAESLQRRLRLQRAEAVVDAQGATAPK